MTRSFERPGDLDNQDTIHTHLEWIWLLRVKNCIPQETEMQQDLNPFDLAIDE